MLELIALILVVFVSVILGLITFYNNPKSATNKIFSIFATSIVFWAVVLYISILPLDPIQQLFFIRLSMLAAILMSTAVLFLCLTVPSEKITINKRLLAFILCLACLGMITAMSPLMFTSLNIDGSNVEPIAGPGMIMFLITGLGYSISGIFILLRKYIRSIGRKKAQLGYLLLGISIMHALLIYANFIVVLVFKSSALMNYGPLFSLTFLLSAAYAIVKHRLMEIRVLVTRTVSFAILVILIAVIYSLILFTLSSHLPENYRFIVNVLTAVILASTFNVLKKLVEKFTVNIFHHQSYNSADLLESLGEITRSSISIDNLTRQVLEEIISSIHITHGVFVIKTKTSHLTRSLGYTSPPQYSENTMYNLEQIAQSEIVLVEEIDNTSKKFFLLQHDLYVLIPLKVKNSVHGLLALGPKASGQIYSQQDIDVLEIFAPQISIAIQNALSYDEIKHFADTLKNEVEIATHELKAANRHLKHLDRLKNEFIFIATHELKNPVTAMRGYLSMLNEGLFGKIPEKMQEPLTQLNTSNQQLVELVNDLLQIARSEAKTLTIHSEVVDLCSLVDVICGNLKALADQKKITFSHSCPNPEKLNINADPQRVKEILNNLISNAIKYSDKGTITITHEVKDSLVITHVTDQGVGISASDQKKLFTRFFRVEAEAVKGIPGTGLGLYIIKQIIEKMGGTIWLRSEVDKGSTFSFSLPKAN